MAPTTTAKSIHTSDTSFIPTQPSSVTVLTVTVNASTTTIDPEALNAGSPPIGVILGVTGGLFVLLFASFLVYWEIQKRSVRKVSLGSYQIWKSNSVSRNTVATASSNESLMTTTSHVPPRDSSRSFAAQSARSTLPPIQRAATQIEVSAPLQLAPPNAAVAASNTRAPTHGTVTPQPTLLPTYSQARRHKRDTQRKSRLGPAARIGGPDVSLDRDLPSGPAQAALPRYSQVVRSRTHMQALRQSSKLTPHDHVMNDSYGYDAEDVVHVVKSFDVELKLDEKAPLKEDVKVKTKALEQSDAGTSVGGPSRVAVEDWSVDDVVKWADTVPVGRFLRKAVIANDIDGKKLLSLTRDKIRSDLGLTLGHAIRMEKAIERLTL